MQAKEGAQPVYTTVQPQPFLSPVSHPLNPLTSQGSVIVSTAHRNASQEQPGASLPAQRAGSGDSPAKYKEGSQLSSAISSSQLGSAISSSQLGSAVSTSQLRPPELRFSEQHKAPTIQIINKTIVKQIESSVNNTENRLVCLEAPIVLNEKSFYAFQVINLVGHMAIGIGRLQAIEQHRFAYNEATHAENDCYLLANDGQKWYPHDKTEASEFRFTQYDVILIECDPVKKRLRFKKKDTNHMAVLEFDDKLVSTGQWHVVVDINTKDDSIAIFDTTKK